MYKIYLLDCFILSWSKIIQCTVLGGKVSTKGQICEFVILAIHERHVA